MALSTIPFAGSPLLSEMVPLLRAAPEWDEAVGEAARKRQSMLTKPLGSLGRLEDLAVWFAGWQGRVKPDLCRPCCLVFAGNHGIAARGVSAYPSEVTKQMVANFEAGGAAINQLCEQFGIELRVISLDLDIPTADFTRVPAMSVAEFEQAFHIGFDGVAPDASVLLVGEMGIGNTTAASAICMALFGGAARRWVGPGTGLDKKGVIRKCSIVESAISRHSSRLGNPLEVLRILGGREMVAIAGAVVAARLLRIPVLLDGFISAASVAPLHVAVAGSLDHCAASHLSAEPGHSNLLNHLELEPVLRLGMRLGEASGAAVAYAILSAAIACHNGMATFEEAGVSKRD